MTLVEIRADLTRTADALERIGATLERLAQAAERLAPAPVAVDTSAYRPATAEDVRYTDDAKAESTAAGRALFAQLHAVVPDSEAFAQAMQTYESEMRSVYPDREIDWDDVFSRLARQVG